MIWEGLAPVFVTYCSEAAEAVPFGKESHVESIEHLSQKEVAS